MIYAAVGQKFIPHVLCMGFYFQNINKSFQMLAQGYEELKNDGILGNISRWLNKEGGEMSLCSLIKTGGHVVSSPPPA